MTNKIINKLEQSEISNSTIIQGNNITYINEDKKYVKLQESYFREIFEILEPNTLEQNIDIDSKYRFSYEIRLSKFCGRSNEIKRLQQFLHQPNNFLWWAITGHAGSGKSRLAYEFALQYASSWLCCLFTYKNEESIKGILKKIDLEELYPQKNMLIIVDYVFGREMIIKQLIEKMSYYLNRKIRILLLERKHTHFSSLLLSVKENNYIDERKKAKLLYDNKFLDLEPLSIVSQKEIIRSTFKQLNKKFNNKDIKSIQKKISDIDPGLCRPLYLQMLAEAWHSKIIQNRNDLLALIIEREDYRWKRILFSTSIRRNKHSINFYMKKLIYLITFVNSVGKVKIEGNLNLPKRIQNDWSLIKQIFIKSKSDDYQNNVIQNLIEILNGDRKSNDNIIYPIQPDTIREYMVLHFLDIIPIDDFLEDVITFNLKEFSYFISMCSQDFPNHKHLINLLNKIPTILAKNICLNNDNENIDLMLSESLYTLIRSYLIMNRPYDSITLLTFLEELSKVHPQNDDIISEYSDGLYALIWSFSESNRPDDSLSFINTLEMLSKSYPQNNTVILDYANGLYALIWTYSKLNKDENLPIFFHKLDTLYNNHLHFQKLKSIYLYAQKIVKPNSVKHHLCSLVKSITKRK